MGPPLMWPHSSRTTSSYQYIELEARQDKSYRSQVYLALVDLASKHVPEASSTVLMYWVDLASGHW